MNTKQEAVDIFNDIMLMISALIDQEENETFLGGQKLLLLRLRRRQLQNSTLHTAQLRSAARRSLSARPCPL